MDQKSGSSKSWRIYIGNLDRRLANTDILKLASKYGKVKAISERVRQAGPKKGKRMNYCFVEFEKQEEADKARISMNGKIIGFKVLQVRWATDNQDQVMITNTGKRKYDCNNDDVKSSVLQNSSTTGTMVDIIQKKLKAMEKKD